MVYELTETERRVLYSRNQQTEEEDRTNVTDVYGGIKNKVQDSIAKLIFFSQHLDAMKKEDSKYVTEIKEVALAPQNFSVILSALMMMESWPRRHKEALAISMFEMSVRHILPSYKDDEIYEELVQKPLDNLIQNLGKVSRHKFYRDEAKALTTAARLLKESLNPSPAAPSKAPKTPKSKNTKI